MRNDVLPYGWPRGLKRFEAARYVGVGTTYFDKMVKDGRMPKPRRMDGSRAADLRNRSPCRWDLYEVDAAISDLAHDGDDDDDWGDPQP